MFRYRAKQHSRLFQVYAYASVVVFIALLVAGLTLPAYVLAIVGAAIFAYTRLNA
jgi:hypothetical protein